MMCVCRRGRPAIGLQQTVQLVPDRRLLELIPIDSVTLRNERGHGERAHCRLQLNGLIALR
jgi:hypothetical protein